jgi:YfiH family protein
VAEWTEHDLDGIAVFRPSSMPPNVLVGFSGRGVAPEGEPSPTAHLARRFARALGHGSLPIVRATQVHGNAAVLVRDRADDGSTRDAGECDVLATDRPGMGLAVQTADCVAVLLASGTVVAAAHAGWRGSAKNAAAKAVEALRTLGGDPADAHAWIGPSIGVCCYQIGGDVSALFAGDFLRSPCGGRRFLDLKAVNRAQLVSAGVPADRISVHPACTLCGGDRFASYRRDGAAAGRMIALIARFEPGAGNR